MTTRAEWLAERRQHITGTDIAAIVGVSKFSSPLDIYLSKVEETADAAPSEAMESGVRLERTILDWYQDREATPLCYPKPFTLRVSDTFPIIAATLDAQRTIDACPVDAKNIRWQTPEFGEPMTDQIPLYYAAQLLFQIHVTRSEFADLAVLFSGQDLRVYRMHKDEELLANLLERALAFWNEHVIPRVPPPIDGSASWTTYLKERVKQASEQVIAATPELHQVAATLAEVEAQQEVADANAAMLQSTLKAAIGEAKGLVGANWRATWSQSKDTVGVDWEAAALSVATSYALSVTPTLTLDEAADVALTIVAKSARDCQHITRKGSRSFRFTFKG